QVRSIAENLEQKLSDMEIEVIRNDGFKDGKWAVLDYGSVIVHIFNDATRMFYCLEKLWSDGKNVEFYKG
ncbi:MAG: ribosome silencing factor, partial [Clostridia bacterium]